MNREENKDIQKEEEIEELLKSITEDNVDEKAEATETKKKKNIKKTMIWASAGAGVIVTGLALAIMFSGPENEEFIDKTKTPEWIQKDEEKVLENLVESRWGRYDTPIELKSWSKTPYIENQFWADEEKLETVLKEGTKIKGLITALSSVQPGEQMGYNDPNNTLATPKTNDLRKQYLETGEKNPDFRYAVREDYIKSFIINSERLLNPLFGRWGNIQNPGQIPNVKASNGFEELKPMFSENWWNSNISLGSDASKLPILADWNNDNFGGLDVKVSAGQFGSFYGEIDKEGFVEGKVLGKDENNSPIIEIKAPVNFYAFSNGEELITKKGTLTLTLKTNPDIIAIENRVIIDNATLQVQ